jgi:hypothetical protein
MEKPSKFSKFVQSTIALLTGDTDTALALKNERLASAAIKGQLSALEGELVKNEVAVENAEDALKKSIYPTSLISNQESYVDGVLSAQEKLDEAVEKLDSTKKTIEYLNSLLKSSF